MAKFIQLINLDEIKTLRITCGKCHAHWLVPVPLGENALPKRCNYCKTAINVNQLEYINRIEIT